MKKKILIVVGTRPNFIKITRFREVVANFPEMEIRIAHTGQHFDYKMADVFFDQFELKPDFFLNIETGTANTQMANIMIQLEKLILDHKPNLVIAVGDVNSTLATAITANKMGVKLAHLESGLRSFDRTMPEEHNRILTDELADYFFVTEQSGYDHLVTEGKKKETIFFVGNTMIDTLVKFSDQIENSPILEKFKLSKRSYVLMTIHRPATVDSKDGLNRLFELTKETAAKYKIVFPMHPRTLKNIEVFGMTDKFNSIRDLLIVEPLDYFAFQKLIKYAALVLTDSGGIQEESTFLKVPCLTLRSNTERPVTITEGTNELVPFDLGIIRTKIEQIVSENHKKGGIPKFWDGRSTERILQHIASII